ncbi:glucosaminidase domain-containing protein [Pseudidiomarina aestuarii]
MQSQKFWHGSLLVMTLSAVAVCVYLPIQLHNTLADVPSLRPGEPVVLLEAPVHTEVPDFTSYTDTRDKKQAFFAFLAPLVQAENSRIEVQRDRLLRLHERWKVDSNALKTGELAWLKQLASLYRVKTDSVALGTQFDLLLRRVDVVPEALVLVQAANESGWGTSRFARDGLNFFGQWCFSEGCGIVPDSRPEGANHEVQKFATVNASVRSYLRNINTHPAYLDLRVLREQKRLEGADIRALDLTPGLLSYSERGEDYIDELNSMIRVNRPIIVDVIESDANSDAESNLDSAPGSE